jgi:Uma2 family endonuclease
MAITLLDTTQRIVLSGIQWCTYERLLQDRGDSHAVYLTYDQGTLELMAPSFAHEYTNRVLAMIVETVALAYGVDLYPAGSTTFTRADLARGFEPDSCYYISHAAAVRGKPTLNLVTDPPPDLVVEIDITRLSLDKFPLYAVVGVPEVWRYTGDGVTIAVLQDNAYVTRDTSTLFPSITARQIAEWIQQYDQLPYPTWVAYIRNVLQTRS